MWKSFGKSFDKNFTTLHKFPENLSIHKHNKLWKYILNINTEYKCNITQLNESWQSMCKGQVTSSLFLPVFKNSFIKNSHTQFG